MVIKREQIGRWSSKGTRWGVVIKSELMGRWSSKGAGGKVLIKRELMWMWSSTGSRWSSKGSWWGGGHQKGAGVGVIKRELMGEVVIRR